MRPEHPCARRSLRRLQKYQGQVSWLKLYERLELITVARPRGIFTRFPILPASVRGTLTLQNLKNNVIDAGRYHAKGTAVNLGLGS